MQRIIEKPFRRSMFNKISGKLVSRHNAARSSRQHNNEIDRLEIFLKMTCTHFGFVPCDQMQLSKKSTGFKTWIFTDSQRTIKIIGSIVRTKI